MKKVICILMVFCLIGAFGCAKEVELTESNEVKKVEWMMRDNGGNYDTELKIFKWMNEVAGIEIVPVMIPPDVYMEKLSIMVAGGSLPDIINVGNQDIFIESLTPDFNLIQEIGAKGLLVSMTDNLDKLPHYKAWMDKFPSFLGGITASDGDVYIASTIRNYSPTSSLGGVIRSDLSGTTEFETFGDLLATLTEMRSKTDKPIWTNRNGILDLNLFSYSFGTALIEYPYYDQYAKKFVNPVATQNYKDAIIFFKTLVEQDILTPEWASYPEPQWYTDAGAGDTQFWVDNMMNAPTHMNAMKVNGITGRFEAFVPPKYNDKFYGWAGKSRFSTTGSAINAKSESIDEILVLFDWLYDLTNHDKLYWGELGVTYKLNASGTPIIIRDGASKDEAYQKLVSEVYGTGENSNWVKVFTDAEYYNDKWYESERKWYPYGKVYGDNVYTYSIPSVSIDEAKAEKIKEIKAPLNTYIQENVTNFINGKKSMNEYDDFVAKVESMGINEVVEIYNK